MTASLAAAVGVGVGVCKCVEQVYNREGRRGAGGSQMSGRASQDWLEGAIWRAPSQVYQTN